MDERAWNFLVRPTSKMIVGSSAWLGGFENSAFVAEKIGDHSIPLKSRRCDVHPNKSIPL
jgi:hypothetical protein